jgi:hypothetical protein
MAEIKRNIRCLQVHLRYLRNTCFIMGQIHHSRITTYSSILLYDCVNICLRVLQVINLFALIAIASVAFVLS